jgi:hypothetical protein
MRAKPEHEVIVSSFSQLPTSGAGTRIAFAALMLFPPGAALAGANTAVATIDFLNSIGVVTTFPDRGQPLSKTIEMVKYCGFRWIRAGTEGLSDHGPTTMQTFLDLHRETGVRFSWGLGSGGSDVAKLVGTAKVLANVDALLAIEGSNEPNNWAVTYKGGKNTAGARILGYLSLSCSVTCTKPSRATRCSQDILCGRSRNPVPSEKTSACSSWRSRAAPIP